MGINLNFFRKTRRPDKLTIGGLQGGGVILSYRCTNSCGHCLICGSPKRENRWLTPAELDDVFGVIKKAGPDAEMHIGGGEAFLNPDCVLSALGAAKNHGVRVSYVETNGFWGRNPGKYRPILQKFYDAGLRSVLISVSPFHAEFITPETTMGAISLVREVFGYGGAFVWISEFESFFEPFDKKRPVKIKSLPAEAIRAIADLYYLIPGGRAGYMDPPLYKMRGAREFFITDCERELLGTAHFHIDCYGNYMPGGLCAGIAPCSYGEIGEEIDISEKPVIKALLNEGVRGLFNYASKYGYAELKKGYAGKCHLCVDIRKFLFENKRLAELKPDEFYKFL
ncbi:MAG TPA: radical SAM protein [Candidatus Wallbacteria bacterium]|mgnify:CR=1 FL=1|nr:radical SAM protein [Candidatus Wallbacteria bacterium]